MDFPMKVVSQFFETAPGASKNTSCFKSGQKRPKFNLLASFTKLKSKSLLLAIVVICKIVRNTETIDNP